MRAFCLEIPFAYLSTGVNIDNRELEKVNGRK